MSDLTTLNQLSQREDLVFCLPGEAGAPFDYSDGEDVERYLFRVLNDAEDLSSRSAELQGRIVDWPSEYHLSSDRSNILRGFNLDGVERVLELGSGCGAISRYLGELGLQVDAVEGSPVRAALGKLRCRDLDNVRVVNANYNDLTLPQDHYDLVLFIGVVEYAHRFHPTAENDMAAAVQVLGEARSVLAPDGVVIAAIENRLGLKYIMGCHEDHYAKRYIGIHGYPESAGIATYSCEEWKQLIAMAGFAHNEISHAFPDYKIPRLLLGDDYLERDRGAFNHLEDIAARDYVVPVEHGPAESIFWQAAGDGRFLGTIANSFCILMSDSEASIGRMMSFDFCHLPGPGRKNRYAVMTRKPKNEDRVQKIPVSDVDGDARQSGPVRQQLADQPYLRGNLLSVEWMRAVLIYTRRDEFDRWLERYYRFLGETEDGGQPLSIDMLPINIIVDADGRMTFFDQEWEVDWSISREYLMFRALLNFIVDNWKQMKDFLAWLELYTVRDFIEYGFRGNSLHLEPFVEQYVELENRFHQEVAADPRAQDVQSLLDTVFDFSRDNGAVYASCLWRQGQEDFRDERRVTLEVVPDPAPQTLEFVLPDNAEGIEALRFDPFDLRRDEDTGFYQLDRIALVRRHGDTETALWQLDGAVEIAAHCRAENTVFEHLDVTGSWLASGDFPRMEFDLGQAFHAGPEGRLLLRVELRLARSKDYMLAYRRYLAAEEQFRRKVKGMEESMDYLRALKTYNGELEETIEKLNDSLAATRSEIADIKASKPFRIGMKLIQAAGVLKGKPGAGAK